MMPRLNMVSWGWWCSTHRISVWCVQASQWLIAHESDTSFYQTFALQHCFVSWSSMGRWCVSSGMGSAIDDQCVGGPADSMGVRRTSIGPADLHGGPADLARSWLSIMRQVKYWSFMVLGTSEWSDMSVISLYVIASKMVGWLSNMECRQLLLFIIFKWWFWSYSFWYWPPYSRGHVTSWRHNDVCDIMIVIFSHVAFHVCWHDKSG